MLNSLQPSQPNNDVISPIAINAAKAIRQVESNGNYSAQSKDGSYGAYQFLQSTWNQASQKYLGSVVPWKSATREQQNEVAVKSINDMIQSGKANNIGEVASIWNRGKPDTYLKGLSGTNSSGVHYDVAKYAEKVANAYQEIKGLSGQSNGQVTIPNAPEQTPLTLVQPQQTQQDTSQSPTLGQDLSGRIQDATTGLNSLIGGQAGSGQSRVSGALQIGGAIGDGIGDVVNKGLELIPGVKALESVIGKGVGKLAQTPAGQKIVESIQSFTTAHPELAKDIGAGFNIVTALPILDGLGAVKDVALDGASRALKNTAEKVFTKDLTATAARTVGGRTALESGGKDAIKTLIDERALPQIVDEKYSTAEAYSNLNKSISDIENNELQPTLKKASTSGIDTKQPIENLRKEALADIEKEFKASGNVGQAKSAVNKIFDDYKSSYGDYVSLQDVNDMKRGIRTSVNFNSPKLDSDISYHIGQALQKNIETSAQKLGLSDVHLINGKMARLIKAQKMLKYIENKPIKTGVVTGALKDAATFGGEALGSGSGVPLAGGYVGREAGGYVGKKLSSIPQAILNRTGKNATTIGLKTVAKRAGLGAIGTLAQQAN